MCLVQNPVKNGEFKTFTPPPFTPPPCWHAKDRAGGNGAEQSSVPPEQEENHTFTPWQGCRGSLGTGQQIRGCPTDISPPQQSPSANLLLDLSFISLLQPCGGPFWRQLVQWDEALQGWCPHAGQGLWGTGRDRSTGNPPALTVCQGWVGSSRRRELPWLSPQESPQHVMLTRGFLYHHRDPLSPVLKNNSGIILVPPSLCVHQLCSPWKCSAGPCPKRNPKAAPSFVPGMFFQGALRWELG